MRKEATQRDEEEKKKNLDAKYRETRMQAAFCVPGCSSISVACMSLGFHDGKRLKGAEKIFSRRVMKIFTRCDSS